MKFLLTSAGIKNIIDDEVSMSSPAAPSTTELLYNRSRSLAARAPSCACLQVNVNTLGGSYVNFGSNKGKLP